MVRSSPSRPATRLLLALGLASAALAGPLAGRAEGVLTAESIRIGDHPGHVRVVVDFRGGRVLTGEVVANDPDPFADGRVSLPLTRPGVRSPGLSASAHGVRARIAARTGRIVLRLRGERRRFKYVQYSALRRPDRLVVDLIKSRPPVRAAVIRRAADRCLVLERRTLRANRVRASGRARNLFEGALAVRLRDSRGRVLAEQGVTAAEGRWRSAFGHPPRRRQVGTLEAVALSAKDGTLDCLVQSRVRIGH